MMSFIGSFLSMTFVLFFMNDLSGLLNNSKWDGLLCFLCEHNCLILIDKIALLLFSTIFVIFSVQAIKIYKWKFLFVPILACLAWLLLMLLHLLIVYVFFIYYFK